MKIVSIEYPTELSKCNIKNDNIDVLVKLENGRDYCVTVTTTEWIKDFMKDDYLESGAPDIIVSELKDEIIRRALADYCKGDAYWFRVYSMSTGDNIPE